MQHSIAKRQWPLRTRFLAGGVAFLAQAAAIGALVRAVAAHFGVAFPWDYALTLPVVALLLTAPLWLALNRWVLLPLARIVAANRDPHGPVLIPVAEIPDDEIGEIMRTRNDLLAGLLERQLESRGRAEHLRHVLAVHQELIGLLGHALTERETLRRALAALCALLQARYGVILFEKSSGDLPEFAAHGLSNEDTRRMIACGNLFGLRAEAIDKRETLCLRDISTDPRHADPPSGLPFPKTLLSVPVIGRNAVFGRIFVAARTHDTAFTREDTALAGGVARVLGAVIESRLLLADLRAAESRFHAVLKGASDGIVATDRSLTIQIFSRAAERMFGYRAETVVGQDVRLLLSERTRREYEAEISRYRETRHFSARSPVEVEGLRKDGSVFPVELTIAAPATGDPPLLVGIVRDIAARKALERTRSDFTAMVTHDIKNPLSVILGYVDILEEEAGDRLNRDDLAMLHGIHSSAERILDLVQNFLLVARSEAGKLELNRKDCDLATLIHKLAHTYESIATASGLHVECQHGVDSCPLNADPEQLERVFANLLNNALKHSPPGGSVRVVLRVEAREAVVSVSDLGPGISEEDQRRLFTRYGTLRGSGDPVSTGLGLYVVKTITEAHDGSVTVNSQPGKGATFTVRLPIARTPSLL